MGNTFVLSGLRDKRARIAGEIIQAQEIVARRSKVRRSAGGLGLRSFSSSLARTKVSIGVFAHALSFTAGTACFFTGCSDQKLRWAEVNVSVSAA